MAASDTTGRKVESTINEAGLPRANQVLAVFDTMKDAQAAAQALRVDGAESTLMEGQEAAEKLQGVAPHAGPLQRLERLLKFAAAGESNDARRYAEHIEQGKVVIVIAVPNPEDANEITNVISAHNGYDVTHFRDWTIEYKSPSENADHGLPTHAVANTPDIDG